MAVRTRHVRGGDVVVPVIACCCNKGWHRSEAAWSIIRHVLAHQENVVTWSWHSTKDTWHRGTCGGENCVECTGDKLDEMRRKNLAEALRRRGTD